MGKLLTTIVACLACAGASAGVYRCVDADGRMAFRDKPCASQERQTRLVAGAPGNFAGCYQVDDSLEWEGGGGSWRIEIDFDEGAYLFREMAAVENGKEQEPQAANVPLHRASPEELDAATNEMSRKVTSGIVLELPDTDPAAPHKVMGLFNAWDANGQLQLVAYLPFVNGAARRVACP